MTSGNYLEFKFMDGKNSIQTETPKTRRKGIHNTVPYTV